MGEAPEDAGRAPIELDEAAAERLLELTSGEAAPCFQCGVCTAVCPWSRVHHEPFSIRGLIRKLQLGILEEDELPWLCTDCRQCEAYCPRGVHVPAVIRALRQMLWERREVLPGLPSVLWSLVWNGNPLSQPPSQRAAWAEGLELEAFDADRHEVLLFIGCTSSYDRRAQRVARALARVLRAGGVPFGILGNEEPCCGETVLRLGHRPYFEEIAAMNASLFAARDVERMVTLCPHCLDVFKHEYPRIEAGFEVQHYTEFLANLLEEGRLEVGRRSDQRLTFHDPCLLGRGNGIYDPPRALIQAVAGRLLEMAESREEALCCGGGGGRMWMETPPEERFAELRVKEAARIGAERIVTACPTCIACLEDSLGARRGEAMDVIDVAELLAENLGAG